MEIIKDETSADTKLAPRVAPTAVTYFDVMPQMIGYILGSKWVPACTPPAQAPYKRTHA